jgi:hypothetical protein
VIPARSSDRKAGIAQTTKKENATAARQLTMDRSDQIFVAGHRGMVGSALSRSLESEGFLNLLVRDRSQLDLRDESAVSKFFAGKEILIKPNSPTEGVTVAMIKDNGAPIEFLQFDRPESEIWPHESKFRIT